MVKKILPVLFLSFVFSAASAQMYNAKGFYRSGVQLKNQGKLVEALGAFRQAIRMDKKMDSAYYEIGLFHAQTTTPDSAVWYFKKALSIKPTMAVAHLALGNYYRDIRPNFDSALTCYFNALKTDSLNKVTYYSIAWCYNAKKENEKAIPYAIKALDIDNNYKAAYNELGHAYRRTGKFKEAIEQFKKNLSVSVVDLAILYTGFCYAELKDKENALLQYEELKKVNEKMAVSLKKRIDAIQ